jgi:hypothetical protein
MKLDAARFRTDKRGGWKIYRKTDPEKSTPEYLAWRRMNAACRQNKTFNNKYYYEKGIKVFQDWQFNHSDKVGNNTRYRNFLVYVGSKPKGKRVLGRINKGLGFVPGNVRWMELGEAQQNKCPQRKFSYARDCELIDELERRGYIMTATRQRASLTNDRQGTAPLE